MLIAKQTTVQLELKKTNTKMNNFLKEKKQKMLH